MRATAKLNDLGNILTTPFIMPSSRALIKSGWAGASKIDEFCKRLCEYSWPRTRDYTMAVIILTVVVASSKADDKISVSARVRNNSKDNNKDVREQITLSDYIQRKVNSTKFKALFEALVNIEDENGANRIANLISKEENPHG